MPDGLRRCHHSRQSHFVTFTCYHRLPQRNTGEIRDVVVEALEHARIGYRFRVYGFVVMPEHVHLLLSEPERATLAQAIQSLKIASAKRTDALRGSGAPLWQKRYYDRNIRDHDEFLEKLDHIHENPVKRNLCTEPQDSDPSKPRPGLLGTPDWRWSSCRHYARGEDSTPARGNRACRGPRCGVERTARKRELKLG